MKQINQFIFSLFLSINVSLLFSVYACAEQDHFINEYVEAIKEQNMQIFPSFRFRSKTFDYRASIERTLKFAINPCEKIRRKQAFEFFETFQDTLPLVASKVIDSATWQDLNFYAGDEDKESYFASHIDRVDTELGRILLYATLADVQAGPEHIRTVKKRQETIRSFIVDTTVHQNLDKLFSDIAAAENAAVSLFTESIGFFHAPVKHMLFRRSLLNSWNKSPGMLQLKHTGAKQRELVGLFMKLLIGGVLTGYAATRIFGIDVSQWLNGKLAKRVQRYSDTPGQRFASLFCDFDEKRKNYWWLDASICASLGVLSLSKFKPDLKRARDTQFLQCAIHAHLNEVAKYVSTMRSVHAVIEQSPLGQTLPSFHLLTRTLKETPAKVSQLQQLFDLLKTNTFKSDPEGVCFYGRVLCASYLLYELTELLKPGMYAMAEIDMYRSLARLYTEHRDGDVEYSFVEFIQNDTPVIQLDRFWNPFLSTDHVVPSDIYLGGQHRRNGIVTGPNAGGKSTALKAIALSLIMAQTFGIAPASHAVMTPFAKIITYLNIKDDIGVGNSLFKSEVLRAQQLKETVQDLEPGQFCFAAIDEMFSGTSPVEGAAAAYSVARHLGQYDNSICMIATHFPLLTHLEHETDAYANYHVAVEVRRNGDICYQYKLVSGASRQNVALDILRSQGFEDEIVATAQDVVANRSVWG